MPASKKERGAFQTIGELSSELGLPTHILRYWETRFPQLKPLTRAGNRRYYRPEDVALTHRIHHLLNVEGYTIKGAQKALLDAVPDISGAPLVSEPLAREPLEDGRQPSENTGSGSYPADADRLVAIRDRLVQALALA